MLERCVPLALVVCAAPATAQELGELCVGQWVEVKGELAADGRFVASALEVLPPSDEEVLIGVVEDLDRERERFVVLGRTVRVSDKTEWKDLALKDLRGKRVKVEGHAKSTSLFSARTVAERKEGRDRIEGRIDEIVATPEGLDALVQGFRVRIPASVKLENEAPLRGFGLAPERTIEVATQRRADSDDFIPGSIRLLDDLYLGALVDLKLEQRENWDLDEGDRDRLGAQRMSVRTQLLWTPSERFTALFTPRYEVSYRADEANSDEKAADLRISEAWGYLHDPFGIGLDVQAGRQEFVDDREWLYKRNLDGVRAVWRGSGVRIEGSATTVLDDGSDRDEHSQNLMLYVSNDDERRQVAAYVVDRRDDRAPDLYPIHFGARVLGEWVPQTSSWIEASIVRGYEGDVNVKGFGFDVGTTVELDRLDPVYFSVGFAYGSGDRQGSDGTDESFRQTGLQRNNGKLGGVTSFRYYGEVLEPELSNLAITTVGIGARLARRTSLDLVFHDYRQARASDELRDTNLDDDPDGEHEHLGRELDLVFGSKALKGHDFEVVLGWFDPGAAFPDADDAWVATFQWRWRF